MSELDYEVFRMNIDPSSPFAGMIDCHAMLNDKERAANIEKEYNKDIVMQEVYNTKNRKKTICICFSTADLIELSEIGEKKNFNRILEVGAIKEKCDPLARHIVVRHFVHEGRNELPPHYRCLIYIKSKESDDPIMSTLDVDCKDFEHYKRLVTISV